MKPKTIGIILIILLVLIIHMQNTQVVTLNLLFWQLSMSQIVLMFIILTLSFAAGFIVAKLTGRRRPDELAKPVQAFDTVSGDKSY